MIAPATLDASHYMHSNCGGGVANSVSKVSLHVVVVGCLLLSFLSDYVLCVLELLRFIEAIVMLLGIYQSNFEVLKLNIHFESLARSNSCSPSLAKSRKIRQDSDRFYQEFSRTH